MPNPAADENTIWFVYDGQCPICSLAAQALQIRKSVGRLELVDARRSEGHPVLSEVNAAKLDLDQGMVMKYGGSLYHGADALHLMALIGSGHGWFNLMNAALFRSKPMARIFYPVMRAGRNLAIRVKGVGKIENLERQG